MDASAAHWEGFWTSTRVVAVPVWAELTVEQRNQLDQMSGSIGGEMLFGWLFRWFFVPHELGHALQTTFCSGEIGHFASERQANDVAVAFWMVENPQPLGELEAILSDVISALPNPVPDRENASEFFDSHYDALGSDPLAYGYFQLHFVLDSLSRRDELAWVDVLRQLCHMSDAGLGGP